MTNRVLIGSAVGLGLMALVAAPAPAPAQAQTAPSPPPHPLGFFVTSATPTASGALGGLAGADKVCQDLAATVGAGGRTWHAYLSVPAMDGKPAVNARDRIGSGPWYNAKNVLVGANVAELHGDLVPDRNNLSKATMLSEKGEINNGTGDTPNRHDILSGSDPSGRALPAGADASCLGWTDGSDKHKAMLGHSDRIGVANVSWNSAHMSRGCSAANLLVTGGVGKLYCFAL